MAVAEDTDGLPELSVERYYGGKCIFITGATGFVGKVLLSRLLHTCPDISEILLLIKPTKTKTVSTRLEELLQSSAFDGIRGDASAMNKVHAITGNVILPNFGLSEEDLKKVVDDASVVFHCAASVRFQDEPRNLLNINLIGVQNLVQICHQMAKLEAMVYVSTAYSFCNKPIISEDVFCEKIRPRYIIEGLQWMDDEQLNLLCDHLVKNRPSLYQFSKAMAEILIMENRGNLPVIIVRPSIITAAFRDPFPGWIDTINGPSGFIALSSQGILRTLHVKSDVNADWVPVDVVANTIILAAHYLPLHGFELSQNSVLMDASILSGVPVINCVCPQTNMTTWTKVVDWCLPLLLKYPSIGLFRPPGGFVTSSLAIHTTCKYIFHYLPAAIVDCIMMLMWKKARMLHTYKRIHGAMNHLQLYSTHKFVFTTTNMRQLMQTYSSVNDTFPIDQNRLNWAEYMENYVLGVRRFCLKEDDSTIPQARKKLKKLYLVWVGSELILLGLFVAFIAKRSYKYDFKNPFHSQNALKLWNVLMKLKTSFVF